MRKLTDHIVTVRSSWDKGDTAPQVEIRVMDEPGPGGANHVYLVSWPGPIKGGPDSWVTISFQNGPIDEAGPNGITQEVLLAIVIDRLRSFQAGPFASPLNNSALRNCEEALDNLKQRTRDRIARGVGGKSVA